MKKIMGKIDTTNQILIQALDCASKGIMIQDVSRKVVFLIVPVKRSQNGRRKRSLAKIVVTFLSAIPRLVCV